MFFNTAGPFKVLHRYKYGLNWGGCLSMGGRCAGSHEIILGRLVDELCDNVCWTWLHFSPV